MYCRQVIVHLYLKPVYSNGVSFQGDNTLVSFNLCTKELQTRGATSGPYSEHNNLYETFRS